MTDLEKIEELQKEIDEELTELYDMQTVLRSLHVVLHYQKTGKPYPENDMMVKG